VETAALTSDGERTESRHPQGRAEPGLTVDEHGGPLPPDHSRPWLDVAVALAA